MNTLYAILAIAIMAVVFSICLTIAYCKFANRLCNK
jgi:hypothetical protein